MIYLTLNYYSHIFLTNKYRFVINLFIILLIYSFIYEDNIIGCMNRETPITPKPTDAEVITRLEYENARLIGHITALEEQIINYTESQQELLAQVRSLQSRLDEANSTIGELVRENFDLRTTGMTQKQTIENLQEEIENADKHYDDLLYEVFKK